MPASRRQRQTLAWLLVTTGRPMAASIRSATSAARSAVQEMKSASASGAVASTAAATIASGRTRAITRSSSRPKQVTERGSKPWPAK